MSDKTNDNIEETIITKGESKDNNRCLTTTTIADDTSFSSVARRDNIIDVDDDVRQVSNKLWPHKRGNFPSKSEKRKKVESLRNNVKEELDSLLNAEKGQSPLILFKLRINEREKIKPNSICLGNASIVKQKDKVFFIKKYIISIMSWARILQETMSTSHPQQCT